MEAELKYQSSRFARKRNIRRFSRLRKEDRKVWVGRGENAPSRRKSFRLDDKTASSNSRKRGDDIVHCFQEIFLCSVVKDKNATMRVFYIIHCGVSSCEFFQRNAGKLSDGSLDVPVSFFIFRYTRFPDED